MELGASNWAYLYRKTLHEAIEDLARCGYGMVEICATPPHVYTPSFGHLEARDLKRLFAEHGLHCVTVNPTETNLVSPNPAIRQLSFDQFVDGLRFAMEAGARYLVVIPGRMNPLMPVPYDAAREMLIDALGRLLREADNFGVEVTLETSPFGFLGTGAEIASVVDEIGDPKLGITFDVANVFAQEDPVEGLRATRGRLRVVHLADTQKARFGHGPIGTGEVDFQAVHDVLEELEFDGPVIYEMVDGQDPANRFLTGREALERFGFNTRAGWSAQ